MNRLLQPLRRLLIRIAAATRVRLPTDPIPSAWHQIIARQVPLIARLPPDDQDRLYHLMQLFLKEVPMEGCGALTLSDEMRLTIAAQACLLLLKMPYPRYNRVRRVLVYPAAFVPYSVRLPRSGEIATPELPAAGQAWQSGVVILGWDEVRRGALDGNDGYNVVFHEFAHMLDAEDGVVDGVPIVDSGAAAHNWHVVLSEHFAEHVRRVEEGEATVLDPYGASNKAEFFAVATEAFFERPHELCEHLPRLYRLLADFYKLDPMSLINPSGPVRSSPPPTSPPSS